MLPKLCELFLLKTGGGGVTFEGKNLLPPGAISSLKK